jgi:uncharacterized membrane protein (DUF485 family)
VDSISVVILVLYIFSFVLALIASRVPTPANPPGWSLFPLAFALFVLAFVLNAIKALSRSN